eukprot:gene24289-9888_t
MCPSNPFSAPPASFTLFDDLLSPSESYSDAISISSSFPPPLSDDFSAYKPTDFASAYYLPQPAPLPPLFSHIRTTRAKATPTDLASADYLPLSIPLPPLYSHVQTTRAKAPPMSRINHVPAFQPARLHASCMGKSPSMDFVSLVNLAPIKTRRTASSTALLDLNYRCYESNSKSSPDLMDEDSNNASALGLASWNELLDGVAEDATTLEQLAAGESKESADYSFGTFGGAMPNFPAAAPHADCGGLIDLITVDLGWNMRRFNEDSVLHGEEEEGLFHGSMRHQASNSLDGEHLRADGCEYSGGEYGQLDYVGVGGKAAEHSGSVDEAASHAKPVVRAKPGVVVGECSYGAVKACVDVQVSGSSESGSEQPAAAAMGGRKRVRSRKAQGYESEETMGSYCAAHVVSEEMADCAEDRRQQKEREEYMEAEEKEEEEEEEEEEEGEEEEEEEEEEAMKGSKKRKLSVRRKTSTGSKKKAEIAVGGASLFRTGTTERQYNNNLPLPDCSNTGKACLFPTGTIDGQSNNDLPLPDCSNTGKACLFPTGTIEGQFNNDLPLPDCSELGRACFFPIGKIEGQYNGMPLPDCSNI